MTIYLGRDNSGTPVPRSAGVTYTMPPYTPGGSVIVHMNRSYVDSDLLKIKTVLFYELVHVGQWRDADGHWDDKNGTAVFNGTKDQNLSGIKEIQASACTLEFLQGLLKKKEFSKADIKKEIKREMKNLQRNLKKAAAQSGNVSGQGWGRDLLKRWLPGDLLFLILMKKMVYYGYATSGTITIEELAHVLLVMHYLDQLDSNEDGKIGDQGFGDILSLAIHEARDEGELRRHNPCERSGILLPWENRSCAESVECL